MRLSRVETLRGARGLITAAIYHSNLKHVNPSFLGCHLRMKVLILYRWKHTDPLSGKQVKTTYLLSEENAFARLIDPEPIQHTLERRSVPDSPAEWHMTGAFRNTPGPKAR